MKRVLVFLVLISAASLTPPGAQATPTIWLRHETGIFKYDYLTDGQRVHEPNFLGRYQDLEGWVQSNPQALEHAREHMAQAHKAIVFSVVNFLVVSGGVVAGIATNSGPILWSTLGAGLVLAGFTMHHASKARAAMMDAINTYNGVRLSVAPTPRETLAGLSYTFRLGS